MKHTALAQLLGTTAIAGLLAAGPSAALAQEAYDLGEIIIAGEKAERSLSQTASSVKVLSGEEIDDKPDVTAADDLYDDIPGVQSTGTGIAPTIRGQDAQGPNTGAYAFFSGTAPRATINIDGHYQNFYEFNQGATSVWDVDSVEVFRGPQTTSQGANSIAGAILINTKDPTFHEEGHARLQLGSDNMKRAAFAYSAPLSDEFAARIAVDHYQRDNYVTFGGTGYVKGDSDPDYSSTTARMKLLWQPVALPGFEAMLTYAHSDSNRPTFESVMAPYEDLVHYGDSMPSWEVESDAVTADISYDFGTGIRLTSQTQYSDADAERVLASFGTGSASIDAQTLSNETRLNFGDETTRLRGLAGFYVARTDSDDVYYSTTVTTAPYDDRKTQTALFGELGYDLTEQLTLTGALRFQHDQIERDGYYTGRAGTATLNYDRSFDQILPKLTMAYELTPGTILGAMASKGYNPGGVTLGLYTNDYYRFDEETVWNYELFARSTALGGRLNVTANLFYSDYTDSQRFVYLFTPAGDFDRITLNADKAEAYGLELGADFMATDKLRLNAGLSLLHTEITEFSGSTTDSAGTPVDMVGNEFARAPDVTLTLGASYDITDRLTVGGDVRYVSGYYSDDINDAAYQVDGYTVANLRASYALSDRVELFGYVNNVFDQRDTTYEQYYRGYVNGVVTTTTEAMILDPRSVGFGINLVF